MRAFQRLAMIAKRAVGGAKIAFVVGHAGQHLKVGEKFNSCRGQARPTRARQVHQSRLGHVLQRPWAIAVNRLLQPLWRAPRLEPMVIPDHCASDT